MASIVLGLGTSHTPMLNARCEDWPRFAESDPTIARQQDKEGRLRTYDELVAIADPAVKTFLNPASFEERCGRAEEDIERLKMILARHAPDVVVIIGDDQNELFHGENMPAFLVYWGAEIESRQRSRNLPWDWYNAANRRYYEREPRRFPVADGLALHVIDRLMDEGFDLAQSARLPEGEGEGHAIGFVRQRIMQDKATPVVPILINTFYPPNQPRPRRCYEFGRALRRAIERWDEAARVAIVASGGLSHFTVNEELDRGFLDALRRKDPAAITAVPLAKLNAGNSEIRNWIALAGAVEALNLNWSDYIPGYRTPAGTGTGIAFAAWA
jgi:Catalytic LigB subunit of aromatic ring-opening dioxygenase